MKDCACLGLPAFAGMMAGFLAPLLGLSAAAADEYEVGGPLAGLKLPLFATQHGEDPGHPGCLPGGADGKEGLYPEVELYPGSVEHWRAFMLKMMPMRSFFDQQSQLHNWVAPEIPCEGRPRPPEALIEQYSAPVYRPRRYQLAVMTDKRLRPATVVRCKPQAPQFDLDLGELGPGLYAVRVIGAVETKDIKPFRKALFLKAAVNDGLKGEESVFRQRLGYCDEFYDVADVYFHAPEKRRYHMRLWVDRGSEVDLLVHNISLDDVLAGTVRRPIKTRQVSPRKPAAPTKSRYSVAERLERDAQLWRGFVPLNAQGGEFERLPGGYMAIPGVTEGSDTMSAEEIERQFGAWSRGSGGEPALLLVNEKLGLKYSVDDLRRNAPLPDPYPLKDDGAGLTFPAAASPDEGRVWAPIGGAVLARIRAYMGNDSQAWSDRGDVDAAHDAAVKFICFAYSYPALEDCHMLTATVHDPAGFGRGDRCRRRETMGRLFGHFGFQFRLAKNYDALYDYIKGNELLAQSVGRFVPAVKTPDDLIELMDVYLVQTFAKRVMRYQYYADGRYPAALADVATILGDNSITDSWMEWLFTRAHYYPRPPAGLDELLVSATDREGRSYIGSTSYVFGDHSAAEIAAHIEHYIQNGGNKKYDVFDPAKFPKIYSSLYFPIRSRVAGLWPLRVGDVNGPDKSYTKELATLFGPDTLRGWRWTRDARFAFIVQHYGRREDWSAPEWAEIEKAAATVARAPWMDNRSRLLPGYAAILEAGLQHDDFRFRRSLSLRVGAGMGHIHHDTLDLQLHAQGLPMTVDAGQRPNYSWPPDLATRVHNTVEVDGQNWSDDYGYYSWQRTLDHMAGFVGPAASWLRTMSDAEGAQYMQACVAPNPLARLARRQVALITVDEGKGSQPLGPRAYGPNPAGFPKGVVTPRTYVFDVFRVAGGKVHTYCFHSHTNDPDGSEQPRTNALEVRQLGEEDSSARAKAAAEYLRGFSGRRWYGAAPSDFEAVFTMQKRRRHPGITAHAGTESSYLGSLFDPEAPDKFLKLRLLDVEGATVMKGDLHSTRWEYYIPNVYLQRRAAKEGLESAFAAIIEPYAGESFIEQARLLQIADNERDALRAVAVEVRAGARTDLCFADGRPERIRSMRIPQPARLGGQAIRNPESGIRISGEFAYYSTDKDGLRQASLTGGTLLDAPRVRLELDEGRLEAEIVSADYWNKKVWIDARWPTAGESLIELKTLPADDPQAWQTGITATSIRRDGDRTLITLQHAGDFYRSRIVALDARQRRVTAVLPRPIGGCGFRRGWTASDDAGRRTWRVSDFAGSTFTLEGKVGAADFGREKMLRLWDYGARDRLSMATTVSLRRVEPATAGEPALYEICANAPFRLAMAAKGFECSTDGKQWQTPASRRRGGLLRCEVGEELLSAGGGRLLLRLKR